MSLKLTNRYSLFPRLQLVAGRNQELVLVGGKTRRILRCANETVRNWLLQLAESGAGVEELAKASSSEAAKRMVRTLEQNRIIRPEFTNSFENTPQEKQVLYFAECVGNPDEAQRALQKKHVAILGAGGVGAIVAQHMVGLGVGTLTLIDFDRVDPTNLNRQFVYTRNDIGKSKVEVLAAHLQDVDPTLKVRMFSRQIASSADLTACLDTSVNFIVCAADTPPIAIRQFVCDAAAALSSAAVFAGVGFDSGYVGPLLDSPEELGTYGALLKQRLAASQHEKVRCIALSIGFSNSLISSILCRELTHFLLGLKVKSKNTQLNIDLNTLEVQEERISAS